MAIGDPGPDPGSRIVREVFFDAAGQVVTQDDQFVSVEIEVELRNGTIVRTYSTLMQ